MGEQCKQCLRPLATKRDWEAYNEGEGEHLCWEPPGMCTCNPPLSRSQSKRRAAQITHWEDGPDNQGCWADGPRHYECAKAALELVRGDGPIVDRIYSLTSELRAAREVVEAARDLDVAYSGSRKRIKAALAAYDAARNEQPSPENQSGSQAGSAATGTGSASTNEEG